MNHIISWLPCGTKFKIHDKQQFVNVFVEENFRHKRFKSFLRQLSMYKFQREKGRGGAYFHPHFVKHNVGLCRLIDRTHSERKYQKLASDSTETQEQAEKTDNYEASSNTLDELKYINSGYSNQVLASQEVVNEIIKTFGKTS